MFILTKFQTFKFPIINLRGFKYYLQSRFRRFRSKWWSNYVLDILCRRQGKVDTNLYLVDLYGPCRMVGDKWHESVSYCWQLNSTGRWLRSNYVFRSARPGRNRSTRAPGDRRSALAPTARCGRTTYARGDPSRLPSSVTNTLIQFLSDSKTHADVMDAE